jgi:hypothetical protein
MWNTSSASGKRIIVTDTEVLLTSDNPSTGARGLDGRFPYTTEPEIGRNPLELWEPTTVPGTDGAPLPAFRGNHPGNRITQLGDVAFPETPPTPTAGPLTEPPAVSPKAPAPLAGTADEVHPSPGAPAATEVLAPPTLATEAPEGAATTAGRRWSTETRPPDVPPDEWYSRPVTNVRDYPIGAFEPGGDARGQLVITLPDDADDVLLKRLDNSLNSQGVETQGNLRKYWTSTGHVSRDKIEGAAQILRDWDEGGEIAREWYRIRYGDDALPSAAVPETARSARSDGSPAPADAGDGRAPGAPGGLGHRVATDGLAGGHPGCRCAITRRRADGPRVRAHP